ncbi:MAG TPA: DUF4926 domain-containing protein [Glycomyces sp.]|nr:DUF4926 domain-containing protein [Glycomyces sp.]
MSHDTEPRLTRAPGSAIGAIVVLAITALWHGAIGVLLVEVYAPVGAPLVLACIFNTVLAIGVGKRMRWAWTTAMVWCGLVIIGTVIVSAQPAVAESTGGLGLPVLYVVLGILLARPNTLAWCGGRTGKQPGLLAITHLAKEEEEETVLTYNDAVELTEGLEEYGLLAGSVGTVIAVHDEPTAFEVEFIDDRTETTALVTLGPEQLRLATEPQ